MHKTSNYINALPDFLAMQRVSFCWFITQGLTEELALFSKISDFSQNTEYLMFSEEYTLIKPPYSLVVARKYSGNYRAQLVIPIEVRDKLLNQVYYQNQFPIIVLPLMTTYATFIINGCERVIVSQIIRSPGIYFEKNKNQKVQSQFRRKLSSDIHKLRTFLPSGEAFISEFDLFFSKPKPNQLRLNLTDPNSKIIDFLKTQRTKNFLTTWDKPTSLIKSYTPNSLSIYYYSLEFLKQTANHSSFYFFQCFKFYCLISQNLNVTSSSKTLLLFLKWLNRKEQKMNVKIHSINEKKIFLLRYFQFLVKTLIKYTIIQEQSQQVSIQSDLSIVANVSKLSNSKIKKLLQLYEKTVVVSQLTSQLKINSKIVLITDNLPQWLFNLQNFPVLKQNITTLLTAIKNVKPLLKSLTFRPILYFSTSFKDQFQYFGSEFALVQSANDIDRYISSQGYVVTKPRGKNKTSKYARRVTEALKKQHKYLKSKTQFLLYQKDYEIKTEYQAKYREKELYTATLIPEYGSWVRFNFQKNTRLNPYKYPLKNQEDELIIQLDKITQKPILLLLKEMGLTDLEIYQNLYHSDFFYFKKPVLINSLQLQQPISRFEFNIDDFENLSEFSQIFDPNYYRLGKIGRGRINHRLNLKRNNRLQSITYEDLFAIIDKLISLTISKSVSDDIDHLKNKRIRSIGELLQNLFRIGFQRLVRKLRGQTTTGDSSYILNFNLVNATIREFFGSSQLSQYLDQTNPLSSLTHRRRISGLGPGGLNRDHISFSVRDIHPSHYGRI